MLEYWGTDCITHYSIIPLFHYSISFFVYTLRSLPPLRSSSFLPSPRIERQRRFHIHTRICVFGLCQEKALRSLRTLRFIFSSSSEDAETFLISWAKNINQGGEDGQERETHGRGRSGFRDELRSLGQPPYLTKFPDSFSLKVLWKNCAPLEFYHQLR